MASRVLRSTQTSKVGIRISEEGESSRANDQTPRLVSTQQEHEITNFEEGQPSRANDQAPRQVLTQHEHEISNFEGGQSSRANDQMPIRPIRGEYFNQRELGFIHEQVKKYSGEAKKLQEEADRGITSCIYRILPRLKEINGNSYEPNMVSIGPYYFDLRNHEKFKMAEDCKKKCFGSLLVKKGDQDMQINTYKRCLQRISELQVNIRKCYSEEFEVSGIEFLEMMVLDACFIIEIMEMFGTQTGVDFSRSLAALAWMVPYFFKDFLLLGNQIPFFVLEEIYALTHNITHVQSIRSKLILDALRFFRNGMKRTDFIFPFIGRNIGQMDRVPVLHLLDLVRSSLIPSNISQERKFYLDIPFIHCISKLRLAGIKVSPGEPGSFLNVKFKRGVIEMPNISIDDFMKCLLLNCVAFEQCHHRSIKYLYFTVYATFLDYLVNTNEDVEYLRERNIIDNCLADDSEAVDFINRAGKDLVLKCDNTFYLWKLFLDVDRHYQNRCKWKWASFEREYFDKPWLFLSAVGGILLVLATLFQAVMAFYKYT